MDPTSLPTDNLYKFMAFAGLLLMGFCGWMAWKAVLRIQQLAIDIDVIQARATRTNANIQKGLEIVTEELREGRMSDGAAHIVGERIMADQDALAKSIHVAEKKKIAMSAHLQMLKVVTVVLVLGSAIGSVLTASGFGLWYIKLQAHLDRSVVDAAREQSAKAERAALELELATAKAKAKAKRDSKTRD